MEFKIYHSFDDPVVKEAYAVLESKNDYELNAGYLWNKTWWEVFGSREDDEFLYQANLNIVLGSTKEGEIRLILPLVTRRKTFCGFINLRILSICGDYWGATFVDLLADSSVCEKDIVSLYNFINETIVYDWLWFTHVREGSLLLRQGNSCLQSACPMADLRHYADYEDYRKHNYSRHFKKNLRRRFRQVEEEKGAIRLENYEGENVPWKEVIRLSASKKMSQKSCLYHDKYKATFLKKIIEEFPGHVLMIRVGEKLVSYRISFAHKGCRYSMDTSYDRSFTQGLGILSMDMAVRDSFDKSLSFHCAGTGLDEYKFNFIHSIVPIYHILMAGNSLLGKLTVPIKWKKLKKDERLVMDTIALRNERYNVC